MEEEDNKEIWFRSIRFLTPWRQSKGDLYDITGDAKVKEWNGLTINGLTLYSIRKSFMYLFDRSFALWLDYYYREMKEGIFEPWQIEEIMAEDLTRS